MRSIGSVLLGCLLLLSGWIIVLAALLLLRGVGERLGFVLAGLAIECLGLGLLMAGHRALQARAT